MKTCYTYGHHGIKIGNRTFENFNELPNFFEILSSNFQYSSEQPQDDLVKRNCKFKQYCVLKRKASGRFGYHKFMLMNDEVSFLYSTGSYKCVRFESFQDAKDYYEFLCKIHHITKYSISYNNENNYNIGYEFELLEDYNEDYIKGNIYRIYDSGKAGEGLINNVDYEWVCPSPIIGKTMTKVPGTKWSYYWGGYCQIPVEIIRITNLKNEIDESNESLF